MLFEVINPDKRCVMHTTSEQCIPSTEDLHEMKKAGYTFKLDKKKFTPPPLKTQKNKNSTRR